MKKFKSKLLTFLMIFTFFFISFNEINAASANMNISLNRSNVTIGDTFNVSVTVSAGVPMGAWEFTLDYPSNKLKFISGENPVVGYVDNNNTKSKTYSYTFKAIASGSATIGIKSYSALTFNEEKLTVNKNSKTINIITKTQKEATYSKDNTLKSLSIDGYNLNPTFNKNTTEYKVDVKYDTTEININAKTNDSNAQVKGTGKHKVNEGQNKIQLTVLAENGSSKTYTINVNVKDPNPININIDNENLLLIKRESSITIPTGYIKKLIKIENQEVPAFYNEKNNITLVALKNQKSETLFYIYNEENNTFIKYNVIELNEYKILIDDIDINIDEYTKTNLKINDKDYKVLSNNTNLYIIKAKKLDGTNYDYYLYDTQLNTIVTFKEKAKELNKTNNTEEKYKKLFILLVADTIILLIVILGIIINNKRKTKRRRSKYQKIINEKDLIIQELENKKTRNKNKKNIGEEEEI